MRSSARRQAHNTSIKSRLKTLEKNYLGLVGSGKKEDAESALRSITSALDKAAKGGIIHRGTASRKKSRLSARLNAAAAAPAEKK